MNGETTVDAILDEVRGVPDTRISLPHLMAARGTSAVPLSLLDAVATAALRHSAEVHRQDAA